MARSALNAWYFMNQKFYCLVAHLTVVAALVTSPKEPFTLKEPLKIHILIFLHIQHQVLTRIKLNIKRIHLDVT